MEISLRIGVTCGVVLGKVLAVFRIGDDQVSTRLTYVVYNERDGLNVDPTRQNVSCNEDFGLAVTEGVDDGVALTAFKLAS